MIAGIWTKTSMCWMEVMSETTLLLNDATTWSQLKDSIVEGDRLRFEDHSLWK